MQTFLVILFLFSVSSNAATISESNCQKIRNLSGVFKTLKFNGQAVHLSNLSTTVTNGNSMGNCDSADFWIETDARTTYLVNICGWPFSRFSNWTPDLETVSLNISEIGTTSEITCGFETVANSSSGLKRTVHRYTTVIEKASDGTLKLSYEGKIGTSPVPTIQAEYK